MIPKTLTRQHVLDALRRIDATGIPRGRHSRGYDLLFDGRRYPPKYTVAFAVELATGTFLGSEEFGGGDETNGRLAQLGFNVVPKRAATSPLRVALVSLRAGQAKQEMKSLDSVFSAVRAGYDGPLLMLFSGVSEHWSRDPARFLELAQAARASCVAELSFPEGARYTVYRAGQPDLEPLRIAQVFGSSAQANRSQALVDEVLQQCEPGGPRRIDIAGKKIGVLVCGENNILQSVQSESNGCRGLRGHPDRGVLDDVDIVLNGAHTIMGNWGKLNNRFAWLSLGGRTLAYATNNTNKRAWNTALRVFHDGVRVADGDGVSSEWAGGPFAASFLTDPKHDGYRIVLMDYP